MATAIDRMIELLEQIIDDSVIRNDITVSQTHLPINYLIGKAREFRDEERRQNEILALEAWCSALNEAIKEAGGLEETIALQSPDNAPDRPPHSS